MSSNKTPARMASIKVAAEHYQVHHSTIRRYITDGRITGYRFGPRSLRVDMDELDSMLHPVDAVDRK